MTEYLYKNPFNDYSANVVAPKTILEYWCSPFQIQKNLAGLNETSVYSEKNPIVFMGGRGSGKTMFLRFWSYSVQKELYLTEKKEKNEQSLLESILSSGGIASYIRIDGPALRSFEGFGVKEEIWDIIFMHYFELIVGRSFLKTIKDLIDIGELEKPKTESFITGLKSLFSLNSENIDINNIINYVEEEIETVTRYRSEVAIFESKFLPRKLFPSKSLSFGIPRLCRTIFSEFKESFNFIILIDEYENFMECQQRMINSLIKFSEEGVTFRLGMRLEGFRTYGTINNDDFIKEGRDYQLFVFEEIMNLNSEGYQDYLIQIAKKRLETVPEFKDKDFTDIKHILGTREVLLDEVLDLVKNNRYKHFDFFSKSLPANAKDLLASQNPIIELLAIIKVLRGDNIELISKAVNDFNDGIKSDGSEKLKYDYNNKYRLSLTILFNSIHRKNKLYYSFNTFSYLSSGIVGHFMELCRKSFQYAEFEGREKLFTEGTISKEIQNKSAKDIASREFQMVRRIENYGGEIYRMTENLGNIFRLYHVDELLRYPETNQFTVDQETIQEPYREMFRTAIKWSIIQPKKRLQHSSPGKGRTQLYTLNRIFSPIFNITYRTRGGVNEEYH